MKRIAILIVAFAVSLNIFAQEIFIRGVVLNPQNKGIANVVVSAMESKTSTITTENGSFELRLTQNKDNLLFSHLGYQSQIVEVDAFLRIANKFVLRPNAAINLQTVQIKGFKTPMSFTSTSTDEEQLKADNVSRDVPFILSAMPSVVATSETGTGTGYTKMSVRGTDMSRINVTIDGIPLNNSESQDVYWVNMGDFASSVGKVDLQRGVGTSTNGTSSFGASLNFETKENRDRLYGEFTGVIGSFGTRKITASAGSGLIDSCFALDARFSTIKSDGWVQRGKSKMQSAQVSALFTKKSHTLRANFMYGTQKNGITWNGITEEEMAIDPTYNSAGHYFDKNGDEHFFANESDNYTQINYSLKYKWDITKWLDFSATGFVTTGDGYYEQYKDDANLADYGFATETHDLVRDKWMGNIFYGYVTEFNVKRQKFNVTLNNSYSIYDGDHAGYLLWIEDRTDLMSSKPYYENTALKTDLNFFAKLNYNFTQKLTAYADMNYRKINYTMEGTDDDLSLMNHTFVWNFLNPKAGVMYKLPHEQTLSATFAVANREPTRTNLKDAAKVSNAKELSAETLYDFEFGYQKRWKKLLIYANFYNMQYHNQLVKTGKLNTTGDEVLENVKSSFRRGLELAFDCRPVKEIAWGGNVTFSANKIRNYVEYSTDYDDDWNEIQRITELGTTDISYSPNVIASHKIELFPTKGLSFSFISKFVGKQYFDNSSSEQRVIDSYAVHDFMARYIWGFGENNALDIQFLLNNVFNKLYISNAYGGVWYEQQQEQTWKYVFPQAGINYSLKVTYSF